MINLGRILLKFNLKFAFLQGAYKSFEKIDVELMAEPDATTLEHVLIENLEGNLVQL